MSDHSKKQKPKQKKKTSRVRNYDKNTSCTRSWTGNVSSLAFLLLVATTARTSTSTWLGLSSVEAFSSSTFSSNQQQQRQRQQQQQKSSPVFAWHQHRPTISNTKTSASTTTGTTTALSAVDVDVGVGLNWEEVLYNAQSAASNLASFSLDNDPSNLISSLPIMYGAGLLTSFSPCVWGLLPLTMSYISQAAGEREDQRTTLPTVAFAAGLAAVFCTLGVAVATLGGVFGGTMTGNSFLLPLLSNGICLAMGLQLLGFVQIPLSLPSSSSSFTLPFSTSTTTTGSTDDKEPILLDGTGQIIVPKQQREQQQQDQNQKQLSSLFRTFLLGGSSALVASPCATPVLTSILAYVASAQNAALGALLLLGYTLGYSTPLLLVASTGGQALVELRSWGNNPNNNKTTATGNHDDNKGTTTTTTTNVYATIIAPWVTPLTGGVLLWYGTNGLLVALFGDPSLAGLAPILE